MSEEKKPQSTSDNTSSEISDNTSPEISENTSSEISDNTSPETKHDSIDKSSNIQSQTITIKK